MAPWPRAPVIPQLVDRKTFRDNRWTKKLSQLIPFHRAVVSLRLRKFLLRKTMGCSFPSILCDKNNPSTHLTRVRLQDEFRGKIWGKQYGLGDELGF
ncbi:hypothetical protein TNCV_3277531 [Trichonephila clavipes]|nr:hypothetical protein TNCV_3277531 [Trichonephila clavipes]